jgi:hypothetical protein
MLSCHTVTVNDVKDHKTKKRFLKTFFFKPPSPPSVVLFDKCT